MAKQVDLFKIKILGIDEMVGQLSLLQTELKGVDRELVKASKTISDYDNAVRAGKSVTDAMTNSYIEAKNALPGLTASQKRLTEEVNAYKTAINQEKKAQADATREAERSRKQSEAAAKRQSEAERELQEDLRREVKSMEDLSIKTNALIKVRKQLNLTTRDGRAEFDALTKQISQNNNQLKQYDAQIGNYSRNVGNYSGAITGMFNAWVKGTALMAASIRAIEYTIKIIGDGTEGVELAFARLNNPNALDNLRTATKGTVSDLKLMEAAVKATNFNIPLDALAKGLQFAQKQARDTKQDVDFLVDSFVTGVGRKSVMILDNLGISAVELREKLKGVGTETVTTAQVAAAVMEVVDERMKQAGDSADIAAEKAGRLTAVWQNVKDQATKGLSNFLSPVAEKAQKLLEWITKNTHAIGIFIKVIATATAAVASYIVVEKGLAVVRALNTKLTREQVVALEAEIVALQKGSTVTKLFAAAKYLLAGNIRGATAAFKLFSAAVKANPLGWIVAGITAATVAIKLFSSAINDSTSAQEAESEVRKQAAGDIAREKTELTTLLAVAKNEKISKEEREKAIKKLNEISPKYLGNLKLENLNSQEATEAVDKYTRSIILNAQAKAAQGKIEEISKRRIEIETGDVSDFEGFINGMDEFSAKTAEFFGMKGMAEHDREVIRKRKNEALKETENEMEAYVELYNKYTQQADELSWAKKDPFVSVSDAARSAGDDVVRLRKEIDAIRSGSSPVEGDIVTVIEGKTKELQEAEKKLQTLTGKTKAEGGKEDSSEKKSADERQELIKKNFELINALTLESERIAIEIQAESVEKKLKLQEQGNKKQIAQLEQDIKKQQELIAGAQKGATGKEAEVLSSQSAQLSQLEEDQKTAIANSGAEERRKILENYTIRELNAFSIRLEATAEYNKEDLQLTKNLIADKQAEQEAKLNNDIKQERDKLRVSYDAEREIIDATISDHAEKNEKIAALELARAQDSYALLRKEYDLKKESGMLSVDEAEQYFSEMKGLYDEVVALSEDEQRVTPLAIALGFTDEQTELLKEKAFQLAQDIANTMTNIQLDKNRRWLDNENKRLDEAAQKEMKALEKQKSKGVMSEEEYERRKKATDDKYAAEKEKVERNAFEKDKDIKTKQAFMEMSIGMVRIWSQAGINVIVGSIMSAALAATTALNVAQIQAQEYATGGKVERLPNGKVWAGKNIPTQQNGDDVLATVKRGEVILNEEQQNKLGGDRTFRAIGVPGFSGGGRVNMGPWYSAPIPEAPERAAARKSTGRNLTDNELMAYMDRRMDTKINSIKVYVTETDITNTTNTVKAVVSQSQLL